MTGGMDTETKQVIQEVARETALAVNRNVTRKVVKDTLVSVGINADNPIEAQETMSAIRQIARQYRDPEVVDAIKFAKDANRAFKSTRNRAIVGIGGAAVGGWATGLWHKIFG